MFLQSQQSKTPESEPGNKKIFGFDLEWKLKILHWEKTCSSGCQWALHFIKI